jgi:hypothetical protein
MKTHIRTSPEVVTFIVGIVDAHHMCGEETDDVEFVTLETVAEKFREDPTRYESEGEFV